MRWLAVGLVLAAAIGRRDRRIALAVPILSGAGAIYFGADNALRVAGGASPARWSYVAGALVVVGLSLWHLLRRTDGFDPMVVVAQQLAVGLVTYYVYYETSGLGLDYRTYEQESAVRTAGIELALLAMALAAVGLGITRQWRPALQRLGWSKPESWHLALALAVALVLAATNVPLNLVMSYLMPGQQHAIGSIYVRVFSGVPAWNLPLVAIAAGIGEETLFRGAIQPKAGILVTASLFALIHVQYGFTPVLLWVFVHGLVYGVIRRHLNTTTAALTHALYDFSAFIGGLAFVAFCVVGIATLVYLWRLAARNPRAVWTALTSAR